MRVSPSRTLFAFLVSLLVWADFANAQQTSDLASQITALNRSLEVSSSSRVARPQRGSVPATDTTLLVLQARQKLVEQLIRTNPAAVRSVMLPAEMAHELRGESPDYAQAIEQESQWSGVLEAKIADDFIHGKSTTLWTLRVGDERMQVFFADGRNPMSLLHAQVTVGGVGTDRIISGEALRATPDAITPDTAAVTACSTDGAQNVAVIFMNQPSNSPAYVSGFDFGSSSTYWQPKYFGSSAKSVNSFWNEASFGVTSSAGSLFGSPTTSYTFGQNFDGCLDTDDLATDAIGKAIAAGVDFSTYSRVSIVYPVVSCGFGGLGDIGCRSADTQINHPYSVSWIPVFTYYNTTQYDLWNILAHELGHNFGLNHSSSIDFGSIPLGAIDYTEATGGAGSAGTGVAIEYGDPYTIMGGENNSCGGQYTAFNKAEYLTWLNPSTDVTELTTTGGTFSVVPFEGSSGVRALRVLRDPLTSSWLWLEYRQSTLDDYDSDFASCVPGTTAYSGALTYYESPYSIDGHLFLVDMHPSSSPNNYTNAAMSVGQTWNDPYSLLSLTLNSANSSGASITASYAQPCASMTVTNNGVFASGIGSGSITVTAPNTCSWTASTVESWISFTSSTSGTGNGTVGFSLAANAGIGQRTGYITVQRQAVPLTQAGSGTFISTLNPALQQGFSGTPTFTFNDPLGASDVKAIVTRWQGTQCQVYAEPVPQGGGAVIWFAFLLDTTTNLYNPHFGLQLGTSQSVSNADCTLNGATSGVQTNGNQVLLTLGMTFNAVFGGGHRVSAYVCDGSNNACNSAPTEVSLGTWQVVMPPTPMIASLAPSSGKQGATVPVAIVGSNTHFSGASVVTIAGMGVVVTGTSSSSATQLATTLTIDPSATASARTLTVTTGAEVVTSTFTVNASGQVQLSNMMLTFPNTNPYSTSVSQPVTLTNNGHATLNLSSITASSEFGISSTTCGSTLAMSSSCILYIDFQPVHLATRTGTLTIVDDAPTSPQTISLSGYGNFILPISRPGRPSRPVAVPPGGTTRVPVSKLDTLGIAPEDRVTCRAPEGLECSVERAAETGELTIAVSARQARPGFYTLYLATPEKISSPEISVPVEVGPSDTDDRDARPDR